MSTFSRPSEPFTHVAKEAVAGACPECGAEALRRYPVVGERGWEIVTKCQVCLYTPERERWNRGLGPFKQLADSLK